MEEDRRRPQEAEQGEGKIVRDKNMAPNVIALPAPRLTGEMSLEEAVCGRRSRRGFKASTISLEQVSQVLWAAQGITGPEGRRAAPSAGALYALDIYVAAGGQEAGRLTAGVYHYHPQRHALERTAVGDPRPTLSRLAVGQTFIAEAPLALVITAEYERISQRYGNRAERYVHMEAGHAAQNAYLQVEALGLGTVVVGSFEDEAVSQALDLPAQHRPLYIMPIGYPAVRGDQPRR
jgi:SagB-type dehydrogenase family enzyme